MRTDFIPRRFQFGRNWTVTIPSREEWLHQRDSLPGHGDVWFTDGSRSEDRSGAGYYCRRDGKGTFLSLGRYATVFQTEVMAILGCAQRLEDLNTEGRHISICSDSQAALRALAVPVTRSRLVGECKEALGRLAGCNRLRLFWVPGHTGIRGDEIADRLASLGARSEIVEPEPLVGIAKCWSKSTIKEWVTQNHSRWWTATSGCNHSKEFLGPEGNRSWTEFIYSSNRREARLLVQIITGHGNLRYHLHKMGFETEGCCRWCGEENETALHLLTKCPAWIRTRMKWFGEYLPSPDLIKSASAGSILGFWKEARLP